MISHFVVVRGFLMVLLCAAALGCGGGDTGVPVSPVAGILMVDGTPADGVSVTCHEASIVQDAATGAYPAVASAQSGPDGSFSLSIDREKNGLPAGDYVLTFVWFKMIDSPNATLAEKDFLNRKFNMPPKSPKKFTVVIGEDTDLGTIELTTKK